MCSRVYSTVAEKATCWWWLKAVATGTQSFLLITGVGEVRKQREMFLSLIFPHPLFPMLDPYPLDNVTHIKVVFLPP